MKLHHIAIVLFIISIATCDALPYDIAALKYAIMGVESSFGKDKRDGKAGEIGPYQIKRGAVKDVNDWYGADYSHEDCRDYDKGWEIAILYMHRWATKGRLLKAPSVKDKALVFHYGPSYSGVILKDPDGYWDKIEPIYNKLINYKSAIKVK